MREALYQAIGLMGASKIAGLKVTGFRMHGTTYHALFLSDHIDRNAHLFGVAVFIFNGIKPGVVEACTILEDKSAAT